ncbi:serum amyloid A-1 protein-like [Gigantopelta aegis]|uniref:serum amyloid A-1 protein-like n=1 Tax=Gigantopelta aegis TaxID=1735272 RepID=UPI001B88D108|nr:serum amyloid A-1 protein-like [Gigantopelta aegis]
MLELHRLKSTRCQRWHCKMKTLLLLVVVCSSACVVECGIGSWFCMAWHSITINSDARCSLGKMQSAYNQMRAANCVNCDKYFHCMGNYNAVYRCQRSQKNREIAQTISNCREWGQNSPDSTADQAANRYGRNGGNCASRYLCSVNCMYSPIVGTCRRSNCP